MRLPLLGTYHFERRCPAGQFFLKNIKTSALLGGLSDVALAKSEATVFVGLYFSRPLPDASILSFPLLSTKLSAKIAAPGGGGKYFVTGQNKAFKNWQIS